MLNKNDAISLLNKLGKAAKSFSFYCDFTGSQWQIQEENKVGKQTENPFFLEINRKHSPQIVPDNFRFFAEPASFESYKNAFDYVHKETVLGNSFLTNLTFRTSIDTSLSLEEIHSFTNAKYKLLVPGKFVVFSPETFVKIQDDCIYSYPMKGTIDAAIPDAADKILNDPKETAEHVTIVDLIRNDLSQIAEHVSVTRFRYIDELTTNKKRLLQVSSEVCGKLQKNWQARLGDILGCLLPAGSVSGAPKPETLSIIRRAEGAERGFFTGICGRFDGAKLDTGVMIRFMELENGSMHYRSGGGITFFSRPELEYQEMKDKIYLPVQLS